MTLLDLYQQSIKILTVPDRLRLASWILNDIPPECVVDYDDSWSEVDTADFRQASWNHIEQKLTEEDNAKAG